MSVLGLVLGGIVAWVGLSAALGVVVGRMIQRKDEGR